VSFSFVGRLSDSKSMLNRALIVKSFYPHLEIKGSSLAEDVRDLTRALEDFTAGKTHLHVGLGGTVLRFLALRVARGSGRFRLTGETSLFQRPQQELTRVLAQLGCEAHLRYRELEIATDDWHLLGDGLYLKADQSSQFASAILLSAWEFAHPLFLSLQGGVVSNGYLEMTITMLRSLGMEIERQGAEISVPANQKLKEQAIEMEPDMSSCFAIAAIAALKGEAHFKGHPKNSLQPDAVFSEFLEQMGVRVEKTDDELKVFRSENIKGGQFHVQNCPDLFPVLACLCYLAEGDSSIRGGTQLKHKESNRLEEIANLLVRLGRKVEVFDDGLAISGERRVIRDEILFDPKADHRLAMAAATLNSGGFNIKIKDHSIIRVHVITIIFTTKWLVNIYTY